MKKAGVVLVGLLMSGTALAQTGWVGNVKIKTSRTVDNGAIYFDVDGTPSGVCNYHGVRFRLMPNPLGEQKMLSMIMAAQMAGRPVEVSYNVSSTPGTDGSTGCTHQTMAVAWSITVQ